MGVCGSSNAEQPVQEIGKNNHQKWQNSFSDETYEIWDDGACIRLIITPFDEVNKVFLTPIEKWALLSDNKQWPNKFCVDKKGDQNDTVSLEFGFKGVEMKMVEKTYKDRTQFDLVKYQFNQLQSKVSNT